MQAFLRAAGISRLRLLMCSQLHLSLFSIRQDGRILSKSPDGSISIINNVAEHAIINSSSGSLSFNSGIPGLTTSPVVTTTNNLLSNIGNNQSQNNSSTPNAPIIQDVDDNEISDIIFFAVADTACGDAQKRQTLC